MSYSLSKMPYGDRCLNMNLLIFADRQDRCDLTQLEGKNVKILQGKNVIF